MGFEQNSNFGAKVRSSFDHHFKITKKKGIKAKGRVERRSLQFEGFVLEFESVFLMILLGYIE